MSNNIRIAVKLVRMAKEIVSSNNNIANKIGEYKNFTGIIDFKNKHGKISGIVENADFKLSDNYNLFPISWKDGTWINGTWNFGEWFDGTWKNGIWEVGWWGNGTWEKGTWKNGGWEKGTWEDGIWEDGRWAGGTWRNGTWIKGKDIHWKKYTVNPNEW